MTEAENIELLVLDVDGVLTDGSIIYDDQGRETKRFHVRDGLGIHLAQDAGVKVAVVTGRCSRVARIRLEELDVDPLLQKQKDKGAGLAKVCEMTGIEPAAAAYMGDDLVDLPAIRAAGIGITVADAPAAVQEEADWVTECRGGRGAVREAIERLLTPGGRWEQVTARYRD